MAKIRLVEWDSSFSVGIDSIDADHRRLTDFIARINDATETAQVDEAVVIFEAFVAYLVDHTRREEDLLRQSLPGQEVDAHARQHRAGIEAAEKSLAKLRRDRNVSNLQDSASFLKSWLKTHVFEQDLKIFNSAEGAAAAEKMTVMNDDQ
ncbi:MAG: hemerythrin domain-containing protein [Alphaproteobacteria bacterium]|jgi:hemerythrin-like metal-binding protein|nr:hemerythrin domain-containing protein [Alphaproteobacteria bacterium]